MATLNEEEKLGIMDELMQEAMDQILYEITVKKKDRASLLAELDALTSMKARLYARINK